MTSSGLSLFRLLRRARSPLNPSMPKLASPLCSGVGLRCRRRPRARCKLRSPVAPENIWPNLSVRFGVDSN